MTGTAERVAVGGLPTPDHVAVAWTRAIARTSHVSMGRRTLRAYLQILAGKLAPPNSCNSNSPKASSWATSEGSLAVLRNLADMGVRIAIDDFGTGYSNLAYLRRLPVHTLKLAGPFITRGTGGQDETDDVDLEIVATLVRLAHILGLTVTVEAIETADQLQRLRRLGCDTGQGWYFAPAVHPEAIPGLVHAPPWSSDPPPAR